MENLFEELDQAIGQKTPQATPVNKEGGDTAPKVKVINDDYYSEMAQSIRSNRQSNDSDLFGDLFADKNISVDKNVIKELNSIAQEESTGINLPTEELPDVAEHIKEYKEKAQEALPTLQQDTKDYTSEVLKLDPNFGGSATKDDFEAVLHKKVEKETFFKQALPNYNEIHSYLTTSERDTELIKLSVTQELQKNYDFSESNLADKMARFVNEDGTLTPNGNLKVADLKRGLQQHIRQVDAQAEEHATKSYQTFKEYKESIDTALSEFEFGGIKLDDELTPYIKHFINSGQLDKTLTDSSNMSPKDMAKQDVLLAAILSPEIRSKLLVKLYESGEEFGINVKAKKVLK